MSEHGQYRVDAQARDENYLGPSSAQRRAPWRYGHVSATRRAFRRVVHFQSFISHAKVCKTKNRHKRMIEMVAWLVVIYPALRKNDSRLI
jgi:hypothetical protein